MYLSLHTWNQPPALLNPPPDDNTPAFARVLPELPQKNHIPGCAHLSASVKSLKATEANHQHYFIENQVRQLQPVRTL